MRKILILGAGIYQVPLIKKAKAMGFYVIVCSIPGNYPGFKLADHVYYADTTSKEEILQIAISEKISAILTTGTDVAVKTVGYVCETLGLPGVSYASAELATNKYLMKEAFVKAGVSCAKHIRVSSVSEALQACAALGYPVIIKRTDSSGSRGISRVDTEKDVPTAVAEAFANTKNPYILVEEFVFGHEIGLDGFVGSDGEPLLLLPHDKLVRSNGLTDIPVGHIFPLICCESIRLNILSEAKKAVKSLGLSNCFFNMDILVSETNAYIIEIGARMGATCIPELMSAYCGFDIYEKMINAALGSDQLWSYEETCVCASKLLFSECGGTLRDIYLPEFDRAYESISIDYSIGDMLPEFRNGADRIGQIIVKGESAAAVLSRLDELESKVRIDVTEYSVR